MAKIFTLALMIIKYISYQMNYNENKQKVDFKNKVKH